MKRIFAISDKSLTLGRPGASSVCSRLIAILIMGIVVATAARADKDVITRNLNELPAPARAILKQQFSYTKVSYIKIDKDLFKPTTYEVKLVNGTEVSFDSKGEWTEVDGKRSEVPAFFIPKEIKKQVNGTFPGEKITKIEKDSRKYEVKLTNGAELKFDRKLDKSLTFDRLRASSVCAHLLAIFNIREID